MHPAEYQRMFQAERLHWWYVGLHELVLRYVQHEAQRLGRRLAIFDAGCGTGGLGEQLTAYGDVDGCDAAEEAIRLCHHRGLRGTFVADLNDVDLGVARYDLITCIDVLYHAGIKDDVAVLRMLRRALRPGGLLILQLVAWEFLRSTHDIAVHTRERYRRRPLCRRLQAAGFEIEVLCYRMGFLFPAIAAVRLLKRFRWRDAPTADIVSDVKVPSPAVNRLLLSVTRIENVMLPYARLPVGSSLFALARAPRA